MCARYGTFMFQLFSPSFLTVLLCGSLSYLLQVLLFPLCFLRHFTTPHRQVCAVVHISFRSFGDDYQLADLLKYLFQCNSNTLLLKDTFNCSVLRKTETQSLPIVIVHPTHAHPLKHRNDPSGRLPTYNPSTHLCFIPQTGQHNPYIPPQACLALIPLNS